MKPLNYAILFVLAVAGLAACQKKNSGVEELENLGERKFYATIEQETDSGANVNEGLCVSWDPNDRVSIFNRSTRNDEYRFTGETGDNSGWFELVQHKGSSEGIKSDYTYAVYPYLETTGISDSGILTVALPAQQYFREGSFGSGTNVMVARVDDNLIQFRNALGYLVLKIYGSGIQVSSVTLKGNDDEVLVGNAKITISPKGVPSTKMLADGGKTLTLVCETPVVPGATPEDATEFWFALPPTTFGKGYTVEITDADGNTFTEVTKETVEVAHNQMVSTDPVWLLGDGNNFVSVDKKPAFTLTSVMGGDTAGGYQKWEFYSDKEVRVQIISWPCNCSTQDHIGYHLTLAELDIPGITLISIPLMRAEGDEYTSTNKSVAGAHLSDYRITEDGTHLDFDLSVTLYQETDGDIRIVYSGPVTPNTPEPTGLEVCGPFSGLYLSKGYLTKTEDGYTITGNDQLEIIKYFGNEDVTTTPRHYLQFIDLPRSTVSGFSVPLPTPTMDSVSEWNFILGFASGKVIHTGVITQKLRVGATVNGIANRLFSKVTVDLTGSEYETYSPPRNGKVTGLLLFPDGAEIRCADLTTFDDPVDKFTVPLSYATLQRLMDENGCAFLPSAGYGDFYVPNPPYGNPGSGWGPGCDLGFSGFYRTTNYPLLSITPIDIVTFDGPWSDTGDYLPVRMVKHIE